MGGLSATAESRFVVRILVEFSSRWYKRHAVCSLTNNRVYWLRYLKVENLGAVAAVRHLGFYGSEFSRRTRVTNFSTIQHSAHELFMIG